MRWMLVTGNPVDGFVFTGPYETHEDVISAGDRVQDADWWIAPLQEPETETGGTP
jgi:hypothetical protein